MAKDQYGYLWISTSKGVARYNGYNLKIYNYPDGLANNDIWQIKEDHLGRIWFLTIADKIGYVYKGKYKNIVADQNKTYYPREFKDYQNGIEFLSPFVDQAGISLCIENSDTLFTIPLLNIKGARQLADELPYVFCIDNHNHIFVVTSRTNIFHIVFQHGKIQYKKEYHAHMNGETYSFITRGQLFTFSHFLLWNQPHNPYIKLLDYNNFHYIKINFKKYTGGKDTTYNMVLNTLKNFIYIIGEKYIYKIDSSFNIINSFRLGNIIDSPHFNNSKISFFLQDSLWGKCITTYNKGIFISYSNDTNFKKADWLNLSGYIHVGHISDSVHYWFNAQKNNLLKLVNNKLSTIQHYPIRQILHIVPYNKDTSLMLTLDSTYWYNNKTGKVTDVVKGMQRLGELVNIAISSIYFYGGYSAYIHSNNDFYILAKQTGIIHWRLEPGKVFASALNYGRYIGMAYDSSRKLIWAYNHNSIILLRPGGSSLKISGNTLNDLGIDHIEKLLFDRHGNIYIQEYKRMIMLNPTTRTYINILPHYILSGAKTSIKGNKLVVAGQFGIAFCLTNRKTNKIKPIIYKNARSSLYNEVDEIQYGSKKIILKTDQGSYLVKIPPDSIFDHQPPLRTNNYRLIIKDGLNWFTASGNDTIRASHNNTRIKLDLINPDGKGKLRFRYNITGAGTGWQYLNSDELYLPALTPGKYYHIYIVAEDDVWRSKKYSLTLYTPPYWWEKTWGKRLMWFLAIALSIIIFTVVVFITKKIVTKNTARRNQLLELELKSIYAQINPHFIFNTLNSALSFIKKRQLDDAFIHITTFSKLLRSYIKSARNKYILLNEETANLKNYIELQQTRFKDKFEYNINISENIIHENPPIPSLLLQPLVENAINHGLLNKQGKGFLNITFLKKEDLNELICIIEDNGIGRMEAKKIREENILKEESYGSHLITDLVKVFNHYEKVAINIDYIDKTGPETGTIVQVYIKYL